MNSKHPRPWQLFASLTLLSLALTSSFEGAAERGFITVDKLVPVDFPTFYVAGKVALQRGATPLYYPPSDPHRGYTLLYADAGAGTQWARMGRENGFAHILYFTNPPFSALVMAPLAELPWQWAYIVWQFVTIILTAGLTLLIVSLIPGLPKLETFTLLFVAECLFFPIKENITCGQVNVTILFLWTLGVYLLSRQKTVPSALCFALGTVLKVSPVVAVPLLLIRRQWRWLGAYAAGIAGLSAISVGGLGWQTNVMWLRQVFPRISSGVADIFNRSVAGLLSAICTPKDSLTHFTQWPIPLGLSMLEKAIGVAIGLGFLFWCWRKRKDSRGLVDELILLPLIYLLAAPFSWDYHFVLAILPLAYLWGKAREATSFELAVLYLSTVALGTELPMYLAAYSPWSSPHLIILAIALWPAATGAILWVGMRMYVRRLHLDLQVEAEAAIVESPTVYAVG